MAGRKKGAPYVLTPKVREAIQMYADGYSSPAIAKKIGVAQSTVRRWLDKKEVIEEFRRIIEKDTIRQVAKARRNLNDDLDSKDKKNPYLKQNATFFVLNKYEPKVMGENDGSCTVTFVNGVPELGMPDAPDDGEE